MEYYGTIIQFTVLFYDGQKFPDRTIHNKSESWLAKIPSSRENFVTLETKRNVM